jgi:hypothetical protein
MSHGCRVRKIPRVKKTKVRCAIPGSRPVAVKLIDMLGEEVLTAHALPAARG